MSQPSAQQPGPGPAFPPGYPYGAPAPPGWSLLQEPGSGRPPSEPPAWTPPPMPQYPTPGSAVPGYPTSGYPVPGFVPIPPDSTAVRTQATAALIVSILLAFPCFVVPVFPAIIMSAIALGRSRTNVPLARLLVRISWIWVAVSVALAVAFMAWSIATSTPASHTPSPTPTATAAR